jgi:tetratricopeptide (TPR) repeat protein
VPDAGDLPPLAELAQVGAVRLFTDRAAAADAGFDLSDENAPAVVEICRRLDGIPLALELAAARIKALSVIEIARRLDNRFQLLSSGSRTSPPRHRTLRALIDWTHGRLSNREQMLLGRLSVFAGGWTLGSAESVSAGEGIEVSDVLGLMSSLVEKSLVEKLAGLETVGPRYRMHETIREYARDHLSEEEEALLAGKHRDHFLGLAEEAEPHLCGGAEQVSWLRRLGAEHENLRAALGTCLAEDGGGFVGLRLAGALGPYWSTRGHWSEGRRVCAELLARAEARGKAVLRAKVLRHAGELARHQSEYREAHRLLEESLAIARELGDRQGTAGSLSQLGRIAASENDAVAARSLYEESLAIGRELGDRQVISECLNDLANIERNRETKRALYLESLEFKRELRDRSGEATVLGNLGWLAFDKGDYAEASAMIEQSLSAHRDVGNPRGVAHVLLLRANVAIDLGVLDRARESAEESLLLTRRLGALLWESYALLLLGRTARLQGDLERARVLFEENLPIFKETGKPYEAHAHLGLGIVCLGAGEHDRARKFLIDSLLALSNQGVRRSVAGGLEWLGILAVTEGANGRAARLFGAAHSLREKEDYRVPAADKPTLDAGIVRARRGLGERVFEREWTLGRAMSMEEAIEYGRSAGGRVDGPAAGRGSEEP